jgi:DNA-binding CsgD family transcriptional regulator
MCFFISNVVLKIPEMGNPYLDDAMISIQWVPDLFFVLFMLFWILLVGSLNEMKLLVPVKALICICAVYYIGVELLVHFSVINAIMILNLLFDLFLVANGLFFLIYGIRHKNSFVNKYLTSFLGACMLVYSMITAYTDFYINRHIDSGIVVKLPEEPIIMLGIAVEIATIVYFFHIDPLHLRKEDQAAIDTASLQQRFDLTNRETEIVVLLLEGLTNTEIAERAFISENTVKRHLTSIYKKTNTSNRYDLLAKLMKEK